MVTALHDVARPVRFVLGANGKASDVRPAQAEGNDTRRFLISRPQFIVVAALVAPVAMKADKHHDKQYCGSRVRPRCSMRRITGQVPAYRVYLGEQHSGYHEFQRTKSAQLRVYFRWRHDRPDNAAFQSCTSGRLLPVTHELARRSYRRLNRLWPLARHPLGQSLSAGQPRHLASTLMTTLATASRKTRPSRLLACVRVARAGEARRSQLGLKTAGVTASSLNQRLLFHC